LRVAVGSKNPCKIEAVRKAFEDIFLKNNTATNDAVIEQDENEKSVQIVISSYNVPSGVSDQPFGDVETREGAMNRAKAAYDAACADIDSEDDYEHPDFAVGLEGGLEKQHYPQTESEKQNSQNMPEELWCMAWMAIVGSSSKSCTAAKAQGDNFSSEDKDQASTSWGYAKTGAFLLPPALCALVLNKNMELGDADDEVFKRVNSKHGGGTVGILTDGEIDRADYYVHALKLALVPWIRPELYLEL